MEKNVVLFDIDYITKDEKAVIRLFCKDKDGNQERSIIAIDESFEPYIYVIPNDFKRAEEDIRELGFEKIEKVVKKDFQVETEFLKLIFNHPQDVPKHRDTISHLASVREIREHDIPFYRRYLINNDIFPMSKLKLSGEFIDKYEGLEKSSALIFKLDSSPKSVGEDYSNFRILSFDLEVRNPKGMPDSKKDEIIMIGVSTNTGINKVLSTKDEDLDFVNVLETEKEMIKTFINIIKEENIDILVGYNSDNFDFPYLRDRAKIYNLNLDIGMDGSSIKFLRRGGYQNSASFKGLIHIDLYLVMRRYMSLERYTLERVYLELFGEEKIDVSGDKIWQYWDNGGNDLKRLFEYSLDDVVATLKIAEVTLPLSLELTKIVGQPFFDITRMATGQQAEWYLVRKAYEIDEVIPNKPNGAEFNSRKGDKNTGGYVKEPDRGLHENLVQFDFRSLYPSIIISKNISPDVLLKKDHFTGHYIKNIVSKKLDGKEPNPEDFYVAPEHFNMFAKEPVGFIPSVLGNVLNERIRIKKQSKETNDELERKSLDVQQQALKRLANTMYGIYGFSRFRWYSMECAESITAWGREFIQNTMKQAEQFGFYAIYADTDGFYAKFRQSPEYKDSENKD
ncbi:DNA-directed DNA polymerase [Methanobrevibacter filiformis]|uniref:DNA polymerase n=1 Tax=Methanobrevibacter filiformis TaxID=55758 RepID=A0A166F849_9EURY|nr:DNA-directed DNA polymerase [Methanobrevibacter filiformis]KZX17418.1 DNA polymerase II [Methanobrevibacter filiformis]